MRRRAVVLTVAAVVALPLAWHALIVTDGAGVLAAAFGWTMAVATALVFARAGGAAGIELAAVLGAVAVGCVATAGRPIAVFVPPVAINVLLLWFFGRTLVPGREPLATAIARFVRGSLPPEVERYTRNVTWAWCAFFAANAAVSVALAALAPLAVWSFFANLLPGPLVVAMFVAEYAYRRWRFPAYEHVPPLALLRRLVKAGYFGSASATK
jgi:uncharacterized membrane protein